MGHIRVKQLRNGRHRFQSSQNNAAVIHRNGILLPDLLQQLSLSLATGICGVPVVYIIQNVYTVVRGKNGSIPRLPGFLKAPRGKPQRHLLPAKILIQPAVLGRPGIQGVLTGQLCKGAFPGIPCFPPFFQKLLSPQHTAAQGFLLFRKQQNLPETYCGFVLRSGTLFQIVGQGRKIHIPQVQRPGHFQDISRQRFL